MADIREQLLARLTTVLNDTGVFKAVYRNRLGPDEKKLPAAIILDADEAKADTPDQTRRRPAATPRLMTLRPEVYVLLGERAENVGPKMSAIRAKAVHDVLADEILNDLCGANGSVDYEGLATGYATGRSMQAEMSLTFALTYPLILDDLAS